MEQTGRKQSAMAGFPPARSVFALRNCVIALAFLFLFVPSALPRELQVTTQGNDILLWVSGLTGNDQCCIGATVDEPISTASMCSIPCGSDGKLTRLTCNWTGTHVVNACWKYGGYGSPPGPMECGSKLVTVTQEAPFSCALADIWVPFRILTHKYGTTDSYPMGPTYQNEDAEARIRIKPRRAQPGSTLYLRVFDPPDTSAYVASEASWDDNRDPNYGRFEGFSKTKELVLPTDGSAVFVTLSTTQFAAGDNYTIVASPDPAILTHESPDATVVCTMNCTKSVPITTWKRAYIETDQMYRSGAYFAADVSAGSKTIAVSDTGPFAKNSYAELITSPPIGGTGLHKAETVKVTSVNKKNKVLTIEGEGIGGGLKYSYSGPVEFDLVTRPYLADALGRIAQNTPGPADYFTVNKTFATTLFTEASVELKDAVDPMSSFPYEAILSGAANSSSELSLLPQKWLTNRNLSNLHHLIAAALSDGDRFGLAHSEWGSSTAVIFNKKLDSVVSGGLAGNGEIVAHELAHLWRVNWDRPGKHCGNFTRYLDGKFCTMHGVYQDAACGGSSSAMCPEFYDGKVMFHYEALEDSEYFTIRDLLEPLPEN